MNKVLIIVDLQNDFVLPTGALSVPGAMDAANNIKELLKREEFSRVITTVDFHPKNHISFKTWPPHCVIGTTGANLFDINYPLGTVIVPKGTVTELEEYGVTPELYDVDEYLLCGVARIGARIHKENCLYIVCGVAGDYCVKETFTNLEEAGFNVELYLPGIASIDNKKFTKWAKNKKHYDDNINS